MAQRILIWFRNDLRLHDHEPLGRALRAGAQVVPLYCFDPRHFGQTSFGFPKTGAFRGKFLLEAIADLRRSLRSLDSDLIIRQGTPETVIPALAKDLNIAAVHVHQEVTSEEVAVEAAVEQQLSVQGVGLLRYWGATLYHRDDLPFEPSRLPEVFTQFRKAMEKQSSVNPALPAPSKLVGLPECDPGPLPSLQDLGLDEPQMDDRTVLPFIGGESAGKERLDTYFWKNDCLRRYKHTRNGLLGADYSSKFSPWLALGCLSPRYIFEEVQGYEDQRVANQSTYWLVFELLWRDYFRFVCLKHGNRVFYRSGLRQLDIAWQQDEPRFEQWRTGTTGIPFVDANMRELLQTGFMSNRGRQNVASFLTKNLGIDWRMGAEWFESQLIDYDVCSNYGNWNYTAGVGNDARGFRYFNIPKQAKDYDPKGDYVKHWIPELVSVPTNKVHEPWKLSSDEQTRDGVRIGVDYPNPVVDLWKSVKHNEKIYNAALSKAGLS